MRVENLSRRPKVPTAIAVKQETAIRVTHGQVHIMQTGDNSGAVVRGGAKQPERVELVLRVEVIGWLIEKIDLRPLRQHLGDSESAPLTARQGQYVARRESGEPHRAAAHRLRSRSPRPTPS